MKVLQLGPYPPPHGGVQTNLVAIRRLLLKRQVPCAVINLTRFRNPSADGVYYPKNALQVLWTLFRLRCDIIHLHFGGSLTLRIVGLGLVCCFMPGAKAVLTFHSGGYPSSERGRKTGRHSLRALMLRRFDRIIAVNAEILAFLHRLGISPQRVRLIYPHALPPQAAVEDSAFPESLASFFRSHQPVLITVGLLEPEYDLPLQIDVVGPIRERFPNAGLAIIGSGSLEEKLRSRIKSNPCADNILLCGDVPHSSTLRAISQSDLMLRTTLYDGDAVSVREALYLGTPVIATDNGMRPEGVRLVPPANLDMLRNAIEEVLAAPPLRQEPPLADEQNVEEVLKLYEEVLRA